MIPSTGSLVRLEPFRDANQIIRTNGRIQKADLPDTQKQLIILPSGSRLTHLIVKDAHQRWKHGGVQLPLQIVRQCYWRIKGRTTVKQTRRKCVICFTRDRYKQQLQTQQMGELPDQRVRPYPPFFNTGVDFAGY